jgi:hypothetical protein
VRIRRIDAWVPLMEMTVSLALSQGAIVGIMDTHGLFSGPRTSQLVDRGGPSDLLIRGPTTPLNTLSSSFRHLFSVLAIYLAARPFAAHRSELGRHDCSVQPGHGISVLVPSPAALHLVVHG